MVCNHRCGKAYQMIGCNSTLAVSVLGHEFLPIDYCSNRLFDTPTWFVALLIIRIAFYLYRPELSARKSLLGSCVYPFVLKKPWPWVKSHHVWKSKQISKLLHIFVRMFICHVFFLGNGYWPILKHWPTTYYWFVVVTNGQYWGILTMA